MQPRPRVPGVHQRHRSAQRHRLFRGRGVGGSGGVCYRRVGSGGGQSGKQPVVHPAGGAVPRRYAGKGGAGGRIYAGDLHGRQDGAVLSLPVDIRQAGIFQRGPAEDPEGHRHAAAGAGGRVNGQAQVQDLCLAPQSHGVQGGISPATTPERGRWGILFSNT